jgi:uncharacterized protein YqgQ
MRKKIGIVAQYLSSRNDIREIIQELAKYHDITLFLRKADFHTAMEGIEVREIVKTTSFRNFILQRFFSLFGIIPKSRQNYYITEAFKLANTKTYWIFKAEKKLLLFLSRYLPKWISYDTYLRWVDYNPQTNISGLDVFLCFSEIYDDLLLSQLLEAQKKVVVYVYSWDHPCKMVRFSQRTSQYLVWNQGLKEDLIQLQNIPAEKITVIGATQLAYLKEFQDSGQWHEPYGFDYIYFGCATGTIELVQQEVQIIHQIAQLLQTTFPQLKLVVRPYPFLQAWKLYAPLKEYSNVLFDDGYRESNHTFALDRAAIYDKFAKIDAALAFLHLGTTMGFEATYFSTPVLQIDFPMTQQSFLNIHDFIHQYQNDKYLFLNQFPNVITSIEDLKTKLNALLKDPSVFTMYNQHIASRTPLQNFDTIEKRISDVFSKITSSEVAFKPTQLM